MKKSAQLITCITIILMVLACADSPKDLPNKSAGDIFRKSRLFGDFLWWL